MLVLILDHLSSWSHFAAKTLLARGYDAIELGCHEEVLDQLEKAAQRGEEHKVIIVDPLSDRNEDNRVRPFEVARILAELLPSIPLIVASSRPTPDEAVLAYEIGASAYMPKTCDESQLIASVAQAIRKSQA